MFGIFGHKIKTGYTEPELSSFSEFTNIDTSAEKLLFGYVGAKRNKLTIDVEDFISNETENGLLNWVFDQIFHSVTNVFIQFGEKHFSLLVSQWPHAMLIL